MQTFVQVRNALGLPVEVDGDQGSALVIAPVALLLA